MSNPVIKSPYPQILTGTTAPTMTPSFIGQEFINTATGDIYKAVGTNGSYNWGMIGKGETSAFTKTTVPNIFAWWKSDYGVTKDAGNLVSSWADYVNGWAVVNSGGTDRQLYTDNAFNNQPGIYFDGVNDYLQLDISNTGNAYTWFSVLSIETVYTIQKVPIDHDVYSHIDLYSNPSQIHVGASTYPALGTYNTSKLYLISMQVTGASGTAYGKVDNGAKTSVATSHTGAVNRMAFGRYWNDSAYATNCYIMEDIIYNASLTDENRAKVEAYLNNKYAIY